mmetsp:Transcript_9118/g.19474  ORF Transcript_9118/g.19474 Transcript_9118/m.19474 type:complete len:242 (+) Transcript_9118:525-1250(+)
MRHGIRIRGDELAPRILINTKLSILNFVIVDISIESHNHGPNIRIVVQLAPRPHIRFLPPVFRSTKVVYPNQIQLLLNAHLSDHVYLLPRVLELGLLEVRRRGEGGREDFLGGDVGEAEGVEFLFVAGAGFGGVVGDEVHFFAEGAEFGECFGDSFDDGVSPPNNAIAIENENIHIGKEILRRLRQFQHVRLQCRPSADIPTRRRHRGSGTSRPCRVDAGKATRGNGASGAGGGGRECRCG